MSVSSLPLADLQVFAQVVEQRSFAAAARLLGLTTSAVSRSVGRLEAQLGVKLLLRTTRSLSLTEVGAEVPLRFVPRAALAPALECPHCGSPRTERLSAFGSTACKALWRCLSCREPFEHFKPI